MQVNVVNVIGGWSRNSLAGVSGFTVVFRVAIFHLVGTQALVGK